MVQRQKIRIAEEPVKAKSESAAKRRAKREKQEREAAIRAAEAARLEGKAPGSAADYERELLGQPSSSYLWIRYMAFLVNLGEVPKARAVAERALQTINYRYPSLPYVGMICPRMWEVLRWC